MPSITVKQIPDDLYQRLKQQAAVNHRSINGEIIVCIEQALNRQLERNEKLASARGLKEMRSDYRATGDEAARIIVDSTGFTLHSENKEAFYRLVAEVMEDLLLANAIREGEDSDAISRSEIDQILGGKS